MKTAIQKILSTLDERIKELETKKRAYNDLDAKIMVQERINELRLQYKMIYDNLPTEQEQIEDAYSMGSLDGWNEYNRPGEQYYTETFKTDK